MEQPIEKQVTNRLTRLYIIALALVASLSIIGQFLVQSSIKNLLDDNHVVNLAGRQRMMSQQICKTAILLTYTPIQAIDSAYYYNDIHYILPLWKKYHEGLRDGIINDRKINYEVKNSREIKQLFFIIEPFFEKIYNNSIIISQVSANQMAVKQKALREILEVERTFLTMMDEIVRRYDMEATERVNRVRKIEKFLFTLTILTLLAEAFFIFLPLTRYIKQVIQKISQSERDLKEKNQELIRTQADLLKATQEKFDLIREEDNVRSAALLEGQEEERRRISLELHDGIGQMLTGLKLQAEKLNSYGFLNEKHEKNFGYHKNLINDTIETTRMVSFNLMPSVLTDFGLMAALKFLANYTEKTSGIKIKFDEDLKETRLAKNLEINIYRIVQEALNNASKHSKATEIMISIHKKAKEMIVSVADNGIGFSLSESKKLSSPSNGLSNMQTRVRLMNGEFRIESKEEAGTKIFVKIPTEK